MRITQLACVLLATAALPAFAQEAPAVPVVPAPAALTADGMPALPATLARYLSERARTLNNISQQICAQNPGRTTFISSPAGQPPPGFFSSDRFHPSAEGYALAASVLRSAERTVSSWTFTLKRAFSASR